MEVTKYGQKKPDTNISDLNYKLMDERLCRKRLVLLERTNAHPPT